jgi:hypothetical protein
MSATSTQPILDSLRDDAMSDTSSLSSTRRRVPLTTLATDDDFTAAVYKEPPATFDGDESLADASSGYGEADSTSVDTEPSAGQPNLQASSPTRQPAHKLCRGGTSEPDGTPAKITIIAQKSSQKSKHYSPKKQTAASPPKVSFSPVTSTVLQPAPPHPSRSITTSANTVLQSKILPSETSTPETTSTTFFTYRAQLTFGLPSSSDGVNVAKFFRRWIFSSCESIEHFSLIPYEEEKGQQISSLDQVPEDNADFYPPIVTVIVY